jgi:hypothetical protein
MDVPSSSMQSMMYPLKQKAVREARFDIYFGEISLSRSGL